MVVPLAPAMLVWCCAGDEIDDVLKLGPYMGLYRWLHQHIEGQLKPLLLGICILSFVTCWLSPCLCALSPSFPSLCLQVLAKSVKPPTPEVAKLALSVSQQQLALQHMRLQLARLVKKAHPAQVRLYQPQMYLHQHGWGTSSTTVWSAVHAACLNTTLLRHVYWMKTGSAWSCSTSANR